MIKISLDTNAVLDLCYRVYPQDIFSNLWSELHTHCVSINFKFYMCDTIKAEIVEKIEMYSQDIAIFENFINDFKVTVIERDDVGSEIQTIRSTLIRYPYSQNSKWVTSEQADVDLIAVALNLGKIANVITGEYGLPNFDWAKHTKGGNPKVPNACELMNIPCSNWIGFFHTLGIHC